MDEPPLGYIKAMDLKFYPTVPAMRNMQRFNNQKLETVLVPMARLWVTLTSASPRPLSTVRSFRSQCRSLSAPDGQLGKPHWESAESLARSMSRFLDFRGNLGVRSLYLLFSTECKGKEIGSGLNK